MNSTNNPGRVAGFLYLLLLAAPLRLVYIPSKLFVHGNATATANNIAAHETLFRFGIVGDLFTGTMVIFVALALYRLFRGVDQNQAVLMVILGGVLPSREVRLAMSTLLQMVVPEAPQNLIGDNAYDSDRLDAELRFYGIELIAPHRRNRRNSTQDGSRLKRYRRRWKIERLFAWLQNFRRLVVR